jgi:hypothetical protein
MASTLVALQTVTVGAGGSASITFSSIPQTYNDLVVKYSGRSTYALSASDVYMTFNSSTTGYSGKLLYGTGSGTGSASQTSGSSFNWTGFIPGANATSSTFGNNEFTITNYSGSNYKSLSVDGVSENNGTEAYQALVANLWSNTEAITSITLTPAYGNFAQYSTATLYGVYKSPLDTAVEAPTIGTATAASTGANVAFTPSGTGAPATSYVATSSPGSITATGTTSPILVTGLTSGTAYTFTVRGQNPGGTGAASAASNSVTPYDGYESIATLYPTGSTATFSSIPSGFTHLQIRAIARDTSTGSPNIAMIFNGDGGSNYTYYHQLVGDGSSASAGAAGTAANTIPWYINNANSLANVFTACITDILDYTNTNKLKVHRSFSSFDVNGSGGFVTYRSGTWRSTSAITSITLTALSAFASGTVIELYGIR